jgi:transposase
MEVVIGVDPHSRRQTSFRLSTSKENWSGRRLSQQIAKDCGLCSGGQSVSQSAVGLWRAQEEASDDLWHRSSWPQASEWWMSPKLSSRVRVLSTGNARKNDALDATFTALAALRNDRLSSVQPEDGPQGHAEILRLLTERREDLVCERTRALNRLHVLLRDLLSDPVGKQLSTDAAAKLLRRARPQHPAGRVRRRLASEVVRDVRALDRRIAELDKRIRVEVEASGTTLTEIFGVGPILAAKIVGIVGNVARFPSKAHFASYAGVAPIEASSGEVVRHRLSLAGNRTLNQIMHMIAVCQARSDPRGVAYHRKKLAEGKSRREAMRCLKRRVSDVVFKALVADSRRASLAVA